MSRTCRSAAIPGDGIGKDVMPEGPRVLEAAARRFGIGLQFTPIEWASCDYYARTGALMLVFLGEHEAHAAIVRAIEQVPAQGPRTRDLGGSA